MKRDPVSFFPCDEMKCDYRKEYHMKHDQRGQPYGIELAGPAEALHLCSRCTRAKKRDFFYNHAEATKKKQEAEEKAQSDEEKKGRAA